MTEKQIQTVIEPTKFGQRWRTTAIRLALLVLVLLLFIPIFHIRANQELIKAVQEGNIETARYWLKRGANPNASPPDPWQSPMLVVAAARWRPQLVKLLLDYGASPNATNWRGDTALTFACDNGDEKTVLLLLDAGANIQAQTKQGSSALSFACVPENPQEIRILRQLLDRGANVNVRDKSGVTPLMQAARVGNLAGVKALLKRGAEVNARDNKGDTALIYALFPSTWNHIVPTLLQAGATVNIKDINGNSILKVAEFTDMSPETRVLLRRASQREIAAQKNQRRTN